MVFCLGLVFGLVCCCVVVVRLSLLVICIWLVMVIFLVGGSVCRRRFGLVLIFCKVLWFWW